MRTYPVQIGDRYGRWTVLERTSDGHKVRYLCRCDCGTEHWVLSTGLRSGTSVSCGCFRREQQRTAVTKHGGSTSSTYRTWIAMRWRCHNPNASFWHLYGGRGISVDPRWDDFSTFLADMGPRPDGHSIERRDSNGNYTPENCYWATALEQSRNTSRCKYLTYNGETKTVSEWAFITGMHNNTIRGRLARGWTVEDALTKRP